jgi:hypothetical protein
MRGEVPTRQTLDLEAELPQPFLREIERGKPPAPGSNSIRASPAHGSADP